MADREKSSLPAHDLASASDAEIESLIKQLTEAGRLDPENLMLLGLRGIGIYGITQRGDLIPALATFYNAFRSRTTPELRRELYETIVDLVEGGKLFQCALLPFLYGEDDTGLVSTVAMQCSWYASIEDGDLMAGPRRLVEAFKTGNTMNRAGVFAGLVLMGDRRVNELLRPLRDQLTDTELDEVVRTGSGFALAPVIDFYLDWLEELDDRADGARFGTVAAAIARVPGQLMEPAVVTDSERLLPAKPGDKSVRVLATYSLEDYAQTIAERVRQLQMGEEVLASIMREWGLADDVRPPRSKPS